MGPAVSLLLLVFGLHAEPVAARMTPIAYSNKKWLENLYPLNGPRRIWRGMCDEFLNAHSLARDLIPYIADYAERRDDFS